MVSTMKTIRLTLVAALGLVACNQPAQHTPTSSQSHSNQMANLPFAENRPTPETTQTLRDELFFQRATQTYLWALPLINTMGMKSGSEKVFGAGYNVLPIWKKRLDAKTLVTTPNSDVIYAMSYVDLGKDGPLVFEAPPMLQGILLDFWQRPIPVDGGKYQGDVGFFGPDQGKGGKFLILPPGYKGPVPPGYYVYRSGTNNVFVFLRAFYQDPRNLDPPVQLIEQSKIYPLNHRAEAKAMTFPNASGVPANMLPASDASAFDQIKALIDTEPNFIGSPDWLGMLATLGIVKGQPFQPDTKTHSVLDDAAKTGYKMSRVIAFEPKVAGLSFLVYPDRHWVNPIAEGTSANPGGPFADLSWMRKDAGYIDLDTRIWFFTNYFSTSPGMISQIPGKGAKYMMGFTDSNGAPLVGENTYRLNLPANVPAANFWSITLYESENASGLANGQPFPSLGSRDKPTQNPDGSTDLYLAPKAPAGKEGNWMATVPGKGYFVILRFYGPTETALNNSWKPDDIDKR
ncbi:MAG TPA: DUF1254 domain-containing protein [Terriglobales bacterium]|nr:DUF1254 domain-containing protein [Terriglobales bacterium]